MTIASPDLYAVCDEYGVARNTPFPSGFYGKPGFPSSGSFSLIQCVGLSNATFTPDGGEVDGISPALITLFCNVPAVWTYDGSGAQVSIPSGSTATSITFTTNSYHIYASYAVTGNVGSTSRNFTVQIMAADG